MVNKCDLKSCTELDDGGRVGIGQGECKLERQTYINDIDNKLTVFRPSNT